MEGEFRGGEGVTLGGTWHNRTNPVLDLMVSKKGGHTDVEKRGGGRRDVRWWGQGGLGEKEKGGKNQGRTETCPQQKKRKQVTNCGLPKATLISRSKTGGKEPGGGGTREKMGPVGWGKRTLALKGTKQETEGVYGGPKGNEGGGEVRQIRHGLFGYGNLVARARRGRGEKIAGGHC